MFRKNVNIKLNHSKYYFRTEDTIFEFTYICIIYNHKNECSQLKIWIHLILELKRHKLIFSNLFNVNLKQGFNPKFIQINTFKVKKIINKC